MKVSILRNIGNSHLTEGYIGEIKDSLAGELIARGLAVAIAETPKIQAVPEPPAIVPVVEAKPEPKASSEPKPLGKNKPQRKES